MYLCQTGQKDATNRSRTPLGFHIIVICDCVLSTTILNLNSILPFAGYTVTKWSKDRRQHISIKAREETVKKSESIQKEEKKRGKKRECWGAKDAGAGAGRAPPSIPACQPARLTPCQPVAPKIYISRIFSYWNVKCQPARLTQLTPLPASSSWTILRLWYI